MKVYVVLSGDNTFHCIFSTEELANNYVQCMNEEIYGGDPDFFYVAVDVYEK